VLITQVSRAFDQHRLKPLSFVSKHLQTRLKPGMCDKCRADYEWQNTQYCKSFEGSWIVSLFYRMSSLPVSFRCKKSTYRYQQRNENKCHFKWCPINQYFSFLFIWPISLQLLRLEPDDPTSSTAIQLRQYNKSSRKSY